MKVAIIVCLWVVCLWMGHAQADDSASRLWFDRALDADRIVSGHIDRVECDASKPLLCEAILKGTDKSEPIGWMPLYAGKPFPLPKQPAYFFLKKIDKHPYAPLWKKKSIAYYIPSDPDLAALSVADPWAEFFPEWLNGLPSQKEKRAHYTARFIAPLLNGRVSLAAAEQIRYLNWLVPFLNDDAIVAAFQSLAHSDTVIRVRLEAARLLEEAGHGLPNAFYEALLKSNDRDTLRAVLRMLPDRASAWSADMLYYAARDLTEEMQQIAITGLGGMEREYAVPRLEQLLENGAAPANALVAIAALGKFTAPSSVDILIPYLESDNRTLSLRAAHALRAIGSPEALAAIENSPTVQENLDALSHDHLK